MYRCHSEVVFLCGFISYSNMSPLQDLFEIMLDLQRMEKLEFGGLKGKLYSEHAAEMYREFSKHCQALKHSENSPLGINSQVKLFLSAFISLRFQ